MARRSIIRRRRGVGLVELLIALLISAALLTATGVAVHASFQAYNINQEQSELMQQVRLAVNRLVSSIRVTKDHAPTDSAAAAQFAGGATVSVDSISMFDEYGADVVYRYDSASKRVLMAIDNVEHVLAREVEAFSIRMEPMRSPRAVKTGGSYDLLRRATIVLTVTRGGRQSTTVSAAVAPRQNTW